ncbi:hypothetical protein IRJ41_015376, partial [Triplophysa rosa]
EDVRQDTVSNANAYQKLTWTQEGQMLWDTAKSCLLLNGRRGLPGDQPCWKEEAGESLAPRLSLRQAQLPEQPLTADPGAFFALLPSSHNPPCLLLTSQLSTISSATCDHARLADILLSVLAQQASTAASSRRWKAESHAHKLAMIRRLQKLYITPCTVFYERIHSSSLISGETLDFHLVVDQTPVGSAVVTYVAEPGKGNQRSEMLQHEIIGVTLR